MTELESRHGGGKLYASPGNPVYLLFLVFSVVAAIGLSPACKRRDAETPILMARAMDFPYSKASLETLRTELGDKRSQKAFKRELINRRIPEAPWMGRVKYEDVSYQAVFAVDESRFGWNVRPARGMSLRFSIYNSARSRLQYQVSLRRGDRTDVLFRKRFKNEQFEEISLPLDSFRGQKVQIVFETQGAGLGAWLNPSLQSAAPKPRLVLIVMLDTLRADHLPIYGYARPTAPALSELAKDADIYERAYSTTSWTLPAHVSLFSGRDIAGHGVSESDQVIPASLPLLSEEFQSRGYITAAFTGGGYVHDSFGFHRGFQIYSNVPGDNFSTETSERVFRHFRAFHQNFHQQNAFVFLHTYQVHAPYKAPPPFRSMFNPGITKNLRQVENYLKLPKELFKALPDENRRELVDLYDAGIAYADYALIKALTDYLKAEKLYEDAVLVVCSDHGEEFYDHGGWQHGHTLYAEAIRIPLVVKRAGRRESRRMADPVSIAGLARLILAESKLNADDYPESAGPLFQSLPFSPFVAQLPTRFSVIDGSTQFIHNFSGGKDEGTFDPPLKIRDSEAFRTDASGASAPFEPSSVDANRYIRLIREHIMALGRAVSQKKELSDELHKTLRSLGYIR